MFAAREEKRLLVGDSSQGEESGGRSGAAYRSIARFGANPPTSRGRTAKRHRQIQYWPRADCRRRCSIRVERRNRSTRKSYRQALHIGVRPIARLMLAELRNKLDMPDLALDLSELHAHDVAGRARSFKGFVEAGVHPEDASREVGITLTTPNPSAGT